MPSSPKRRRNSSTARAGRAYYAEGGSAISVSPDGGQVARIRAIDEKRRQELKAALERIRYAITANVPPRDQWRFLGPIDIVGQNLAKDQFDLDGVRREIQQAKGTTRRFLAGKQVSMSEILNSLDGLEQDVVDFFNEILGKST